MNRTYFFGIALGIAVLGIALLGNQKRAVAGGCCGPAVCAPACDTCAPATCHHKHAAIIALGPAIRRLASRRPAALRRPAAK